MKLRWIQGVPGRAGLIGLMAMAACSGPPANRSAGAGAGSGEAVGQSTSAVTVCAGGTTLQGVDVSEYQGSIDWGTAAGSGISFAIARVSDGTGHLDPYFSANWSGMKSAGVVRGVYQFFRASQDPTAQADLLASTVGTLDPGDLSPVADVEVMDGVDGNTLISNLNTWVAEIQKQTGRTPMIYSSPGFWDALPSTGGFTAEGLWVADWGPSCPDTPTPWTSWLFWQYSDSGSVPGIPATVDLDEFNGALSDLQKLGGGAPYAAQYVSQSFPLATTALTMVTGQTIPSYIELKNVGSKNWDTNTRIGTTQPRDRSSAFADSTWIGPNRPAGVTGTVAPGGTFKFQFDLHAPDKPGTYYEYFGVVEEGVAWFSDPGQGGPPDNDLEVQVVVVAPQYQGTFKDQSYPLAPAPQRVHPGTVTQGYIELTNTGTQPWVAGTTKLAPIPRDQDSPFADPSWLSPTRVSTVAADVPPGSVGRFPLALKADKVGDYEIGFGLVEEGVTWFADPTLGGGPPDGFLKVHLQVVPQGATLDAGLAPESGAGGSGGGGRGGGGTGGAGDMPGSQAGSSSGCGCKVAVGDRGGSGSPAPVASWAAGLVAAGLVLRSRRRRAS